MNISLVLLATVLLIAILMPRYGLLATFSTMRQRLQKELAEDALKFLIERQYLGNNPSIESLAGKLHLSHTKASQLVGQMESQGLLAMKGLQLTLTPAGEQLGLRVIRAHRLWEKYLADEAKMPLHRIHREAHRLEHNTTSDQLNRMEAEMGFPVRDPHGDPIPNISGKIVETEKMPATEWPQAKTARIIEIEDEPQIAYQQIVATGLRLGMHVRILDRTKDSVVIGDGINEYRLAPIIAANIQVAPVSEDAEIAATHPTLAQLKPRQVAKIVSLDETVQGFTRRRFLDLGLTPGAEIYPELENFFGEPRAYRIRGTLIALRKNQAEQIKVALQETI